MLTTRSSILPSLLLLLRTTSALTFTSPTSSQISITSPITITWTSTPSDPQTFTLQLGPRDAQTLASNIATSTGTYTVSADSLIEYGFDYVFQAVGSDGTILATSGTFTLAASFGSATTNSNGLETVVYNSVTTAAGGSVGVNLSASATATGSASLISSSAGGGGGGAATTAGSGSSIISSTTRTGSGVPSSTDTSTTTGGSTSKTSSASSANLTASSTSTSSKSSAAEANVLGGGQGMLGGIMMGLLAFLV